MNKIIIVCGPGLSSEMAYGGINQKGYTSIWTNSYFVSFPEQDMSAQLVREMLEADVKGYFIAGENLVYFTRYGDLLNHAGGMIEDGVLKAEQVVLILVDNEGVVTEFSYTPEGFIDGNWPYGILG